MADTNTTSTSTASSTGPTSSSTLPPSTSPPSTTPPPPTSTSTPPPITSTPTLSSSTSEKPTSDTSETTSTTAQPTTSSTPRTSQSIQTSLSTAPGGGTVTLTSVVAVTPSGSIGPSHTAAPGTSKTFFQNTGAVAGVFTVVGLIVLGLLIALAVNIRRRREAQRFDREVEEAAAAAAAVPAPAFLDDDDTYGSRGYGGGAAYGGGGYDHGAGYGDNGYSPDRGQYSDGVGQYSDVSSHGTFGQPAMSTSGNGGEAYGMRELGPGVGELYNPHGGAGMHDPGMMAAGAGAAGIGVMRARSTRDPGGYASALNDGASPYPAFAMPGYPNQQHNYNNIEGASSGANGALLDAAGLGAAAAAGAGVQRGISLQHQPYSTTSSHPSDLSRNQSLGTGTGTRSPESYASHYEGATSVTSVGSGGDKYSGFGMPHYVPQQHQGADLRRNPSTGQSVIDDVDPYGGYEPEPAHGKGVRGYADGDESGEEDEGQGGRRVLKVANE